MLLLPLNHSKILSRTQAVAAVGLALGIGIEPLAHLAGRTPHGFASGSLSKKSLTEVYHILYGYSQREKLGADWKSEAFLCAEFVQKVLRLTVFKERSNDSRGPSALHLALFEAPYYDVLLYADFQDIAKVLGLQVHQFDKFEQQRNQNSNSIINLIPCGRRSYSHPGVSRCVCVCLCLCLCVSVSVCMCASARREAPVPTHCPSLGT